MKTSPAPTTRGSQPGTGWFIQRYVTRGLGEGPVSVALVVTAVASAQDDGEQPSRFLEELGVVTHTHLDHRAPSYHLADHADHIHLVCRTCGRVQECPKEYAEGFAGNVLAGTGFVADVTHMAIHGECSTCATR
mgnify:CR=1 FL=1